MLQFTNPGTFVRRDAIDMLDEYSALAQFVLLDPPYEDIGLIRNVIVMALIRRSQLNIKNAIACFMWLKDVPEVFDGLAYRGAEETRLPAYPNNITVWEKPQSTKNTSKDYSNFLEAICVWHGDYFNKELHWANRTGIFVDRLIEKPPFAHKKPDTLVERLVKLHTPPRGFVLDTFAGTGTTKSVCDRCGFYSISSDVDPKGDLAKLK